MTDHNPLCPCAPRPGGRAALSDESCRCTLIARVRADEREQIATESLAWVAARTAEKVAQAIEAECGADCYDGPFLTCTHPKDAAIARSLKEEKK